MSEAQNPIFVGFAHLKLWQLLFLYNAATTSPQPRAVGLKVKPLKIFWKQMHCFLSVQHTVTFTNHPKIFQVTYTGVT